MEEYKHLLDSGKKTRDDLIKLYVTVVTQKLRFQYDPKKLILDLLPDKKIFYTVFMPKKEYSLSQSVADHGRLEAREHRFINFLKFFEVTEEEIQTIFEAHHTLTGSSTVEGRQIGFAMANKMFDRGYRGKALGLMRSLSQPKTIPEKYQYTEKELYSFIPSQAPIEFNMTKDSFRGIPVLFEQEI